MTDESQQNRETRVVMLETQSASTDDDIDLIKLLRLLIGAWKLIGCVAVLVTGAALAYALTAPEVYKAEILLVSADEEASSIPSALGQFGGLAALAGVTIPADSNMEQVMATLRSRKFLGWYIEEKKLLPVLFEEQWDQAKGEWKVEPGDQSPTKASAYLAFSGAMDLSEDKKTGLITLSILWKDPEVAAEWANDLVHRLNDELRRKAIEDSKKRIGYLEEELAKTTVKDMLQVLYSLLESEKRKQMLANVNEEFALEVIDPAVVPVLRDSPNRRQIVVMGGIFGLFLGVFAMSVRIFCRKLRNPTPAETSA